MPLRTSALVALAGCLLVSAPCLAYLPASWNLEHARSDGASSDLIVVGRVVKLECRAIGSEADATGRPILHEMQVATIRVGKLLKGSLPASGTLQLVIGFASRRPSDDDAHPVEARLHNTQLAHDLRLGEVYALCLLKDADEKGGPGEYELRSGPFSIAWVQEIIEVEESPGSSEARARLIARRGGLGRSWGEPVPLEHYLAGLR